MSNFKIYYEKFNRTALRSIAAGIAIGLGAAVYCSVFQESRIIGSACFSLGLISVLTFQLFLYTGRIGLICEGNCINNDDYAFFIQKDQFEIKIFWKLLEEVLLVFPHNIIGIGVMVSLCKSNTAIVTIANKLVESRLHELAVGPSYAPFEKGVITGICMYIAVAAWKFTKTSYTAKCIITTLSVMAFILTGSYHVIADAFYFGVSSVISFWDERVFTFLLIVLIGNSVGSWITHMYFRSIFLCEDICKK